jgi:hypothetical protein
MARRSPELKFRGYALWLPCSGCPGHGRIAVKLGCGLTSVDGGYAGSTERDEQTRIVKVRSMNGTVRSTTDTANWANIRPRVSGSRWASEKNLRACASTPRTSLNQTYQDPTEDRETSGIKRCNIPAVHPFPRSDKVLPGAEQRRAVATRRRCQDHARYAARPTVEPHDPGLRWRLPAPSWEPGQNGHNLPDRGG